MSDFLRDVGIESPAVPATIPDEYGKSFSTREHELESLARTLCHIIALVTLKGSSPLVVFAKTTVVARMHEILLQARECSCSKEKKS